MRPTVRRSGGDGASPLRRAPVAEWSGPGRLAKSNAEQVHLVRKIIEGLGLEIATPEEAREMLALKGGDKTAI